MSKLGTDPEGYSIPMRFAIEREYQRRLEDRVVLYGPGEVVLERDGKIVAVATEIKWERPLMYCEIPHEDSDV